jgi:hypothetical protein
MEAVKRQKSQRSFGEKLEAGEVIDKKLLNRIFIWVASSSWSRQPFWPSCSLITTGE